MPCDRVRFLTDAGDADNAAIEQDVDLPSAFDATIHALPIADTTWDSIVLVGTDVVDALVDAGE